MDLAVEIARNVHGEHAVAFALGSLATLIGARLLVCVVCAIAVITLATWTGFAPVPLPEWLAYVAFSGISLGLVEAVVILVGGRQSAPNFWGTLAANLITALVLAPSRTLRGLGRLVRGTGRRFLDR